MFCDVNADGQVDETEVIQEEHYYPFGMRHEGYGRTVAAQGENFYQYNGKELNEDFGLDMYDYGARFYDASVGRWFAVDPLAEKYVGMSPYNYVADNPIRYIDPNGMEFTEGSWTYIMKLINEMDGQIERIDRKLKEAEAIEDPKKRKKRIEKWSNRKIEKTETFTTIKDEIIELQESNQMYDITADDRYSENGTIPGTGTDGGGAVFNFSNGIFEMVIPTGGSHIDFIAHELKHAHQFENGKFSSGPRLNHKYSNFFYDKYDELEAYKRGKLFGGDSYKTITDLPDTYDAIYNSPVDIHILAETKVILENKNIKDQEKRLQGVAETTRHAFRFNGKTYYRKNEK